MAKKILIFALMTAFYFMVIGTILLAVLAKDEGTLGDDVFLNFAADYLFVIIFPEILFLRVLTLTDLLNIVYFPISILLTAMLYSVATIYIGKLVGKYRRRKVEV